MYSAFMVAEHKPKTQKTISVSRHAAEIECLTCGRRHTVERDEDGLAAIDQVKCSVKDCNVMMCDDGDGFGCLTRCGRCNGAICPMHHSGVYSGVCHECAAEMEAEDAEEQETGADRCPPRE